MRCCIQLCRTKRSREIAGEFTRKNSIVASANFPVTGEHAAGKKRICRDSCADKPPGLSCNYQALGGCFPFAFSKRWPTELWLRQSSYRVSVIWGPVGPFRRRRRRRYVLFDQEPKRRRQEKRDQLRLPVFQTHSLHICCAIKFRKCADGRSLE